MKNVIEILERQYQSFINQERDWNFFLGLTDYVGFINKTPEFNQALNKIKESKLKEIEIIDRFEKGAVNELQKIKQKILKIIKKNIPHRNKEISEALNKLEDYEKGKIDPDHYKSSRLEEGLRNLIKALCKNGYRNLLSGILPQDVKDDELIKGYAYYNLSKKLSLRWGKSRELSEKEETELWGALGKLQLVFRVICVGKNYLDILKKHKQDSDEYIGHLKEMETIKNDGERPLFSSLPSTKNDSLLLDFRKKEFKKDNYKLYATRIHNYLIQELNTKFDEEVSKTEQLLDKLEKDIKEKAKEQEQFEVKVKDRYIWVNDYLLSKPHAVGSNLEFFEYICSKSANTKIERNSLPDFGGLSLKQEVKNKSFIKILNELGFKGEILKAFFPKRGKNIVVYRGNKITKKDLEKAGVKIPLFLKELELAHIKNSPE